MAGILYLCATPIGNLEDMTSRAQRMLAEADIIAAEDTRHTLQLLNRFNIKGRLVRYDEHSKERQGAYLLDELLSGKNIALVSDAGFPGIADPGEQLARLAIDAGVQVVPVPGANAALCALIASGLPASPFFSADFCPRAKKQAAAAGRMAVSAGYDYFVRSAAQDRTGAAGSAGGLGDRQLAAARELTKLHEEFFRGTVSQCLTWLHENKPRGEFCLVIARGLEQPQPAQEAKDPLAQVQELLARGVDKKTALAQVAKANKIPKRELYNKLISEEEGINI